MNLCRPRPDFIGSRHKSGLYHWFRWRNPVMCAT